jgi:hypothetical protein
VLVGESWLGSHMLWMMSVCGFLLQFLHGFRLIN